MNNKRYLSAVMAVGMTAVASSAMAATKVTIGTVNNGDMVRMQGVMVISGVWKQAERMAYPVG